MQISENLKTVFVLFFLDKAYFITNQLLTHCILGNFLSSADFFQNQLFEKNSFRNTIRMSNSLDPDQARRFVEPDLGPNCLPSLSADDTGRQRVNTQSPLPFSRKFLANQSVQKHNE